MLSDATILEAAELAANAFESSPTYREIYRPETRIHGLRRGSLRNDGDGEDDVQSAVSRLIRKDLVALFRRHFKLISQITPEALHFIYDDKNCGPLSEGRGRVMTCFFMLLHSDSEVSIWQKLRAGLLTLLFISGVKSFGRLLAAGDYFDKMKLRTFQFDGTNDRDAAALRDTKNAPISVHLNLARMVVHPDYQGRGIGSAALRRALQTTADEKRLPVVLSTQLDRNVTFYEKLGFRVVFKDEYRVEPRPGHPDYSFTSFFMIRDPQLEIAAQPAL